MTEIKVEISSKAIEKGLDIAKDFLDKLITPAVEEVGLLLKDQVSLWRLKNQIKVLNKAKEYCLNQNIDPKTLSLKLLTPLLDNASLEEDETLQNKWAYLLGNMVDSEQNIDNHVFPYLLSQLSVEEFELLELVYCNKVERVESLTLEFQEFKKARPIQEIEIKERIKSLGKMIAEKRADNIAGKRYTSIHEWEGDIYRLKKTLKELAVKELSFGKRIQEAEYVPSGGLKEYQFSNLIRLGVVKVRLLPYSKGQTLKIPNDPEKDYLTVSFEVEIEADQEELYLTELGELFVCACNIRSNKVS
jgi:hypothetical protein